MQSRTSYKSTTVMCVCVCRRSGGHGAPLVEGLLGTVRSVSAAFTLWPLAWQRAAAVFNAKMALDLPASKLMTEAAKAEVGATVTTP